MIQKLKDITIRVDFSLRKIAERLLPRRLSSRYVIGLSSLALLTTFGQLLIQHSLNQQTNIFQIIRVYEKQIDVSNELRRGAFETHFNSADSMNRYYYDRVVGKLGELVENQNQIISLGFVMDPETDATFKKIVESVERFVDTVFLFNPGRISNYSLQTGQTLDELFEVEAYYRELIFGIIKGYEAELKDSVTHFKRLELLLFCLTLLVLFLEGLFVFRPAVEDLYHALRVRSDFLGRLSHEIRNPMHSIAGMGQMLEQTKLDDQQARYVSMLKKSSGALLDTLNHLLDFSSLESGKIKIEKVSFDLYLILERVVDVAVFGANANGIELILDLSPRVPLEVVGDPGKLQQVLMNLLGNAVKFTKEGHVTLKVDLVTPVYNERVQLKFSVTDTGIGIDSKRMNRIFEPFTQGDQTVRRRFGGTGLGLSISKELVRLMGGSLEVDSIVTEGSCFYFVLPFDVSKNRTLENIYESQRIAGATICFIGAENRSSYVMEKWIKSQSGIIHHVQNNIDQIKSMAKDTIFILNMDFLSSYDQIKFVYNLKNNGIDLSRFIFVMQTNAQNEQNRILTEEIETLSQLGIKYIVYQPIKPIELQNALLQLKNLDKPVVTKQEENTLAKVDHSFQDLTELRILVADDSEENRLLIEVYLRNTPYVLEFAKNGLEALEKFKSSQFDLVLMDLQMPEMDGYTATREIRNWENFEQLKPVPVIAVSAHDRQKDMVDFKSRGFSAYLVKPFFPSSLIQIISEQATASAAAPSPTPATTTSSIRKMLNISFDDLEAQIANLAPDYLSRRRTELKQLHTFLETNDYNSIMSIGHKLKGNAKSYGFGRLSEIGMKLESAGKDKDQNRVGSLLHEFDDVLTSEENSLFEVRQ